MWDEYDCQIEKIKETVSRIKKFLKDYTKYKKYVTIRKEIFRKMGKTNNRGSKALKVY